MCIRDRSTLDNSTSLNHSYERSKNMNGILRVHLNQYLQRIVGNQAHKEKNLACKLGIKQNLKKKSG